MAEAAGNAIYIKIYLAVGFILFISHIYLFTGNFI